MMEDKAKQIFLQYNGNHSYMANDGVYEKYKSYGIPLEKEKEWIKEIEERQYSELKNSSDFKKSYVRFCMTIRKTKNTDLFKEMFKLLFSEQAEQLDDMSRLYIVGTFMDMMKVFKSLTSVKEFKQPLCCLITSVKEKTENNDTKDMADRMLLSFSDL